MKLLISNPRRTCQLLRTGLISLALELMLLTACLAENSKPLVLSNAVSQTPSQPVTPTGTARVEQTHPAQTMTPTIPVYPKLESTALGEDFVFNGESPDCKLPCWHGLVIGQTELEQTVSTMRKVLQLPADTALLQQVPSSPSGSMPGNLELLDFPWLAVGGEAGENLQITLFHDRGTGILQAIRMYSSYPLYNVPLTPQRIIKELGQPSIFLMSWQGTGNGGLALVKLRLVYEKGIVFTVRKHNEITLRWDSSNYEGEMKMCLGGKAWDNSTAIDWNIDFIPPLSDQLNDLTPIQQYVIAYFDMDDQHIMRPVSEFFKVTDSSIYNLALQDGNACLSAEFTGQSVTGSP